MEFSTIILDEAHIIRNPEAKTTRAALALVKHSRRRMCLGTPVQNCAEDLWPIFHFLMPYFLGRRKVLKETLQEDNKAIERLRSRVAPFVLRRIKKGSGHRITTQNRDFIARPHERRAVYILPRFTGKRTRRRHGSFRKPWSRALPRIDPCGHYASPSGGLSPGHGWRYGAILEDLFLDLVDELIAEGHRALVFSSFTKFLALVQEAMQERGYSYQYLDGRTRDRGARVKAFQEGDDPLFLISLKAGGVGLNLTAADYVIILDPWWNPAAEDQAADRAYRIGQDKPVMVYRIVTTDSIEERVLRLQSEKRKLVGDLALEGLARALEAGDVEKLFEIAANVGLSFEGVPPSKLPHWRCRLCGSQAWVHGIRHFMQPAALQRDGIRHFMHPPVLERGVPPSNFPALRLRPRGRRSGLVDFALQNLGASPLAILCTHHKAWPVGILANASAACSTPIC